MLLNPYTPEGRVLTATISDTRILQETFGVVGVDIIDLHNRYRTWTVHALYAPMRGRAIGGIRAKLVDQKGFVTFCNQRDLEVLLDIASPGAYCQWLDSEYAEPDSREWLGFCTDEDDLIDDLFDRELEARSLQPAGTELAAGMGFTRRVHDGLHNDFEEEMTLLWDMCRETGMYPDPRYSTVSSRWSSIVRTRHADRRQLWVRS